MGKRRRESGHVEVKEDMEESLMSFVVKKGRTRRKKVKVCYVCGNRGFSDLLICCSGCSDLLVHKYCFGIIPGSMEDCDSNFYWTCDDCCVLTPDITTGAPRIDSMSEIILVEDEPEPLCAVLPEFDYRSSGQTEHSYQDDIGEQATVAAPISVYQLSKDKEESESKTSSLLVCKGKSSLGDREGPGEHVSAFMEHPKEIMSGLILLVSPSGEIIIRSSVSACDSSHIVSASSFMDCPKEIMNGLVLLASPSGEVIIRRRIDDDAYFSNSPTSVSNMPSICGEISLSEPIEELFSCNSDADMALEVDETLSEYDCASYLSETEDTSRKRRKILNPCDGRTQIPSY